MAAAHVSAVAAMVLASGVLGQQPSPQARVEAVTRRLRTTARSLGLPRDPAGRRADRRGARDRPDGAGAAPLSAGASRGRPQVVRTMITLQGAWWETLFGTLPSR